MTTMHRIIFKKIYFFNVRIKKSKNSTKINQSSSKNELLSKKGQFLRIPPMIGKIAQLENGQKISSHNPDSHLILVLLIFVSQIDPILLSMLPTDYLLCILEKFSRNFVKNSLTMNINTITNNYRIKLR